MSDLYTGYCTLNYEYASNVCATLQQCISVQGLQSLLTWKEGTAITNAILMLGSQTWRKFAMPIPYGISISLQCIDTTISDAGKIKASIIKHFTETSTTVTVTCFALAFNQQFWEKNLNSAYINCSPLRAVLARCIELAISAKGHNRLGFAEVKIRGESSKHLRQHFSPSTFKRQKTQRK